MPHLISTSPMAGMPANRFQCLGNRTRVSGRESRQTAARLIMNILGPDFLVFGVDDVAACQQFLTDYGLRPVDVDGRGGRFVALDGTGIEIRHKDDPGLPPSLGTGNALRKTVYGVAD